MGYWLCVTNEENWEVIKSKHVWGVPSTCRAIIEMVREGDILVFYIKPARIGGAFEVVSRPYEDQSRIFSTKGFSSDERFPYRVRITPLILPDSPIEFKPLIPKLKFIVNKRNWGAYIRRAMIPLSRGDYEVIEGALKKAVLRGVEEKPTYDHNEIRDAIQELGELRGYRAARVEYPIGGRRLDVAWKKVEQGSPAAVFEVHIRGDVFEALVKLMRAREKWPGAEIFLVTTSEYADKAREEVKELPIKDVLHIISCDDIIELHDLMKRVKELEKRCGFP